jgi:hypothetical protein
MAGRSIAPPGGRWVFQEIENMKKLPEVLIAEEELNKELELILNNTGVKQMEEEFKDELQKSLDLTDLILSSPGKAETIPQSDFCDFDKSFTGISDRHTPEEVQHKQLPIIIIDEKFDKATQTSDRHLDDIAVLESKLQVLERRVEFYEQENERLKRENETNKRILIGAEGRFSQFDRPVLDSLKSFHKSHGSDERVGWKPTVSYDDRDHAENRRLYDNISKHRHVPEKEKKSLRQEWATDKKELKTQLKQKLSQAPKKPPFLPSSKGLNSYNINANVQQIQSLMKQHDFDTCEICSSRVSGMGIEMDHVLDEIDTEYRRLMHLYNILVKTKYSSDDLHEIKDNVEYMKQEADGFKRQSMARLRKIRQERIMDENIQHAKKLGGMPHFTY